MADPITITAVTLGSKAAAGAICSTEACAMAIPVAASLCVRIYSFYSRNPDKFEEHMRFAYELLHGLESGDTLGEIAASNIV